MAPKLYKIDISPPVRGVLLTSEALGIKLEHIEVDFTKHDELNPEYLKMNPQHTVPTLEDDGKIIWDSHAISIYLVSKYAKDDSLYPEDSYKRAVVNQRLHFDTGVIFPLIKSTVRPMFTKGVKTIPQHLIEEALEAYGFLEKFIEGHKWTAGDQLTLADFSLVSAITSLDVVVPLDSSKYPNISGWIKRCQQLPYYGVNQKGLDEWRDFIKRLMA